MAVCLLPLFELITVQNSFFFLAPFSIFLTDQICHRLLTSTIDSIDCETDYCYMAWLIRDNRLLIQSIRSGYCSNGTALEMLDQNAYDNCPQVKSQVIFQDNFIYDFKK